MLNRYSLTDYTLAVTINGSNIDGIDNTNFIIGGPAARTDNDNYGGYIGSITVSRSAEMWKTTGDYTGGYIHVKNLDRTGTVKVSINQLSDNIIRLSKILNICENKNNENDDLSIDLMITHAATGKSIVVCTDCRITKIPDQTFSSDPSNQEWTFTCGVIDIKYE